MKRFESFLIVVPSVQEFFLSRLLYFFSGFFGSHDLGGFLLFRLFHLGRGDSWFGFANARLNELVEPELVLGNLFEPFARERRWHAIVSNPPYIGENEIASLEPEVRDFDPRNALVGGAQGWELPLILLELALSRLEESGILIMEIGPSQYELLKARAFELGWNHTESFQDYQQNQRFIVLKK